jgi:Transcriptional regulators
MNPENMFAPLPKGNISDVIVDRITQQLIGGELQPGDKLPTELEFCEQLGVSRNVVREAIKILVALGVVEIRRAEGTFIVEEYTQRLLNPMMYGLILSDRNMVELLEVNICVLCEVLQLVKLRMSLEDKAKLDEIYFDLKIAVLDTDNVDRMAELSTMFYTHLNSCSGNQLMYQVYNLLLRVFSEARRKAFSNIIVTGQRRLHMRNYDLIMEYLSGESDIEVKYVREQVLGAWNDVLVES